MGKPFFQKRFSQKNKQKKRSDNMSKVAVGMSGGVDSAVTAYILKKMGYDVIGVTLKTWLNDEGEVSRCCEIDDAKAVADQLDFPYYAVNCADKFRKCVVEPFTDMYIHGMTPNPCIECNRYVKWDKLIEFADSVGAEFVATGHYAKVVRLDNGRYTVEKSVSAQKDQTYMLYRLTQEQLSRTIMPLGNLTKDEVRKIASAVELSVANKPDSQEICFVADDDYANYIEQNCENYKPVEGNFVDESGNILGRHKGIVHYTVGQRKGLGIALGKPIYVKSINAQKNEVVLCDEKSLYTSELFCDRLNFLAVSDIPYGEKISANVRIRYHHSGEQAQIERVSDTQVKISFENPVRAATPGQSAVFYNENSQLIGGGIVCI